MLKPAMRFSDPIMLKTDKTKASTTEQENTYRRV